jgi:hypothetical protein
VHEVGGRAMRHTTPANIKRINSMFDKLTPMFLNLMDRWGDEHEYEDITDYGEVIKKQLPRGFKLTEMMKVPFGFVFTLDGNTYMMFVDEAEVSVAWKRVA